MRGSCRVRLFAGAPPDPGQGKPGGCSLKGESLTVEPQGEGVLSLPLERPTGGRAVCAAAARELPFLKEMGSRLRVRAVHASYDPWKAKLGL